MPSRTTTYLSALATCLTLTFVGFGQARADQIFVRVEAQAQGVFSHWYNPVAELGGVSLAEYGLVEDLAWNVLSPRDAASGLPTGKRQHKPLTLRVRVADATAMLGKSLTANENLPHVTVAWFERDGATGNYLHTRSMKLTNASLSSFAIFTVRDEGELTTYAEVSFTYQSIGIEDQLSGISYSDSWESPVF